MAAIINTNVGSLNAQRNLSMSQTALATAMQRLSSGLRINSAKDDAAGLAISERFSTQIRGLNQAVRNANDGISLSQTAEGALNTISDNLQRIRELSVQSANATNSASDRAALDAEVQQRLAEVDRVAKQTNFNGQRILDGTFGSAAFQVGANVGQTINVNLGTSMKLADVGAIASATSTENVTGIIDGTPATYAVTAASLTGDYSPTAASLTLGALTASAGGDGTSTYTLNIAAGADTLAIDVTGSVTDATLAAAFVTEGFAADGSGTVNGFTLSGVTTTVEAAITAGTLQVVRADGTDFTYQEALGGAAYSTDPSLANASTTSASTSAAGTGATAGADNSITFTVTPPGGSALSVTLDSNIADADALVSAIQSATGYAASGFTVGTDGTDVTFTAGTPAATGNFTIGGTNASVVTGAMATGGDVAGVAGTPITVAGDFSITVGDADPVNVADGTYTTAQDLVDAINDALGSSGYASLNDDGTLSISSGESLTMTAPAALTSLSGTFDVAGDLSTVNVLTVAGANDAMQRVDAALTAVNNLRADFGAIQNRFESTISNLTTTAENLTASRSRIMDADFAQETAALSRAQILQQAGTAMVAQANQLPQGVLALLR